MTIIEFFDENALENIAGALLCKPERVIFVGADKDPIREGIEAYRSVLRGKGITTEFSYKTVSRHDLSSIVRVLSEIVEREDGRPYIFDLTGGEDLYLVAVGIIMERYDRLAPQDPAKGHIRCQRFNLKSAKLVDCDGDGRVCPTESFDITAEELVRMSGGHIVTDPTRSARTVPWELNEAFLGDVERMWGLCRSNTTEWNLTIDTLGDVMELFRPDGMRVCFQVAEAKRALRAAGGRYVIFTNILFELKKMGLIRDLVVDDTIAFTVKNRQVMRCLSVSGQVLELMVAKFLCSFQNGDGTPLYHDVRVGLVMDWDPLGQKEPRRTINEIDVVAMRGAIPYFISCKNGEFDSNELYKLNAVAEHFGGDYVRKVLVTSQKGVQGIKGEQLLARMEDMGICCIACVDTLTPGTFANALMKLSKL